MIETEIPMIALFNCLVESQKIPIFSVAGEPFNALLARIGDDETEAVRQRIALWCGASGLRLAAPRQVPAKDPQWLLAVASHAGDATAAA